MIPRFYKRCRFLRSYFDDDEESTPHLDYIPAPGSPSATGSQVSDFYPSLLKTHPLLGKHITRTRSLFFLYVTYLSPLRSVGSLKLGFTTNRTRKAENRMMTTTTMTRRRRRRLIRWMRLWPGSTPRLSGRRRKFRNRASNRRRASGTTSTMWMTRRATIGEYFSLLPLWELSLSKPVAAFDV